MNRHPRCNAEQHRLSRRRVLQGALGLCAGAWWGLRHRGLSAAFAAEGKEPPRQALFVWLDGGLSQLESWDPKPGTQFGGPFRAIATSVPGLHICELLPQMAKRMHHVAVVRSVSTKDNSHSAGVPRILRGDPKNRGVVYPYLGSAVAKLLGPCPSGMPPYIWVKPGSGGFIDKYAGFLGPKYGALALGEGRPPQNLLPPKDLPEQDLHDRHRLRRLVNRHFVAGRSAQINDAYEHAYHMAQALMSRRKLFDESTISDEERDRYGRTQIGQHMIVARRMLEAGARFVQVTSYGWDTHGDNFLAHRSLVPKFDQALAAVIDDLVASGRIEHTLIIAMSEFGRTPRINGHVGRDHWPEAWSVLTGGCGLQRGAVIWATDQQGVFVKTEPYDIGHLFHTWFTALGIDSQNTEYDNNGQPLPIAHDDCFPIKELLG